MPIPPDPGCSDSASLAYVLMPFAAEFTHIYETALKPAIADVAGRLALPFSCRRSDETLGPGSITREIVGSIYRADVIVADLSGNNPNVFYELGIAHSLGNKSIMITQSIVGTPFDVAPYRLIRYEATPDGLVKLRSQLAGAVREVLTGSKRLPNNPVQDFLPIPYSSLVVRMEDLIAIERCARKSVWIIQPALETDLKFFLDVIKNNIVARSVEYRYLIPDTKAAMRSVVRMREFLEVDDAAWRRVNVRLIEPYMVESEVVIYDAYGAAQQIFLMSCPDDDSPFWYLVRGSRAKSLRERYETLWDEASKVAGE